MEAFAFPRTWICRRVCENVVSVRNFTRRSLVSRPGGRLSSPPERRVVLVRITSPATTGFCFTFLIEGLFVVEIVFRFIAASIAAGFCCMLFGAFHVSNKLFNAGFVLVFGTAAAGMIALALLENVSG